MAAVSHACANELNYFQGKRRKDNEGAVFYVSFISGCVSGSIASLSVNPFDG